MLFDVYFGLASFCMGLCTVWAYAAQVKGDDMATGVAISLMVFSLWSAVLRFHLRGHAAEAGWSSGRRFVPVVLFAFGFVLVLMAEWQTLFGPAQQ